MIRFLRYWPVLILALWFGGISIFLDVAVRRFESRTTSTPPAIDEKAPWRHARFFVDPDSYTWLSYARDLRSSPHFRVRYTFRDNAPYGRPVHWSQLPVWLLCAISIGLEQCGLPPPAALELAGRILLPVVGFLTFSALWFFFRKRLPDLVAAFLACTPAIVLLWDFHPFRPDHQAFQLAAAFFFSLPLLFSGFGFAPPGKRPPRALFVLSGVAGGFALWFGATVFCFSLIAVSVASVMVLSMRPGKDVFCSIHPSVWRLWAGCGSVTSLAFWLLEYAPNHFSMRLEVNHPLYALSFLGIGEILFWFARFRHLSPSLSPKRVVHLLLALAATLALPLMVLFGPVDYYIPRNLFMLRLHARHIHEFLPLAQAAAQNGHSFFTVLLLAIGPGLVAILSALVRPTLFVPTFSKRCQLAFATPFFILFAFSYIWQSRWESYAVWASLLLVVALWPPPSAKRRPLLPLLLLALPLFVQGAVFARQNLWSAFQTFRAEKIGPPFYAALQQRNLILNWKNLGDNAPIRLLAPVSMAPACHYFGLGDVVPSLYWENLEGDVAAAAAFADSAPEAPVARRLVEKRHVTHILMLEGAQDALMYYNLHTGREDQIGAAHTFGGLLAGAFPEALLPSWLGVDPALNRTVNPALYTYIASIGKWCVETYPVRIYTVRPETFAANSPPPATSG